VSGAQSAREAIRIGSGGQCLTVDRCLFCLKLYTSRGIRRQAFGQATSEFDILRWDTLSRVNIRARSIVIEVGILRRPPEG